MSSKERAVSRDEEIRNIGSRRRNILYLMQRYLQDNGYYQSAELLKSEARLSDEFELCDNIDLDGIYLEYASYYQLKFGKYPRIVRKVKPPTLKVEVAGRRKAKASCSPTKGQQAPAEPLPDGQANAVSMGVDGMSVGELQVVVRRMETQATEQEGALERLKQLHEVQHASTLGDGGDELLGSGDWQPLADLVRTTILRDDIKLSWADMLGNQNAVDIVKEAVMAPLKYPQLFANGLKPWKSVLMHGPPGSGKTLLAKILYAETRRQVTFFNVTSSVVVSKWRGESEKILRILFYLAHKHAPSIIFLDEIEGLTSKRDRPTDHESSKRFKNELLQLLDGMEQHSCGVFVLASTNLPWDIDDAFLRRFEKKLLVQLPNASERRRLIERLLPLQINIDERQMAELLRLTEMYTGDEIRLACKEIAMQAIRRITRTCRERPGDTSEKDIERAFHQIRPLSVKLMPRHEQWQKEHGS